MDQQVFFPEWRDRIVYSADGPQPQVLHEDNTMKVVVVGLEPNGRIPVHAGGAGVFHFLEGAGEMIVDGDCYDVQAGSTVIAPAGAERGIVVRTRLAFIAVRLA